MKRFEYILYNSKEARLKRSCGEYLDHLSDNQINYLYNTYCWFCRGADYQIKLTDEILIEFSNWILEEGNFANNNFS